MKTTFLYGLGMAIAGALINFALYFLGYHDDAAKLGSSQTIAMVGGIVATVVFLVLAIRARRDETPADEAFGYGRALGAGTLTSLWGSLFGSLFNVLYSTVINPDIRDLIVESQIIKMEEQGVPAAQIEQAEGVIRMMTHPALSAVVGFIMALLVGFILSLIIAAFIKRAAVDSGPPPIGG